MTLNLSKRRATDLKGNARVIFPKKSCKFEVEAKIETLRVEAMSEFRKFLAENCNEKGDQKSNLSKKQAKGLKSLQKE